MDILEIKISRFPDMIQGVRLYENDNLLIILLNPVDFVIDGICLINKKYVKQSKETKDILKFEIFKCKLNNENNNIHDKSFDNIKEALKYFYEYNKLIELTLDSASYSLIGSVSQLNEKSFLLNMLSVKAEYLKEEKIEYDKIRIITINSDYLNSLECYLNK